jgi:hypothetical protein
LADGYDYAGQDPIDAYDLSGTAVDPVLQDAGWGGGPPGAYGNGVLAGDVDSGFIDEEGTGIARSRAVGRAGEDQVPGVKNTTRIQSYTGSAKYRVPDRFNATAQTIGEVKNVARLSFTSQLKDYALWAEQHEYQFTLWVRPSTELSPSLQRAIVQYGIRIGFIGK